MFTLRAFFLGTLFLSLVSLTKAADPVPDSKPDPIDTEIGHLMEKDPSTAGMIAAIEKGTELWDAQMNLAYGQLIKKLPEAERSTLQKSQRAWLAYRDANTNLVGAVYGHLQGTMYRPMADDELLELVKGRTLLLRNYLDLLENENGK